jgi:hypothetical protein
MVIMAIICNILIWKIIIIIILLIWKWIIMKNRNNVTILMTIYVKQ